MRRTCVLLVIALILLGAAAVGAGDKPLIGGGLALAASGVGEKADAAVAQLIKDLGDDDYRIREKAGRELVAKGEAVLPQLRAALRDTESPEVQRRLSVMVRKMEVDRLTTPKHITANLKDKTVKAALEEITRQTGYKIEYSGGPNEQKHTFEFDKTPFWLAIDTVANAGGCMVVSEYDDSTIRVYNQDAVNPHVAYAGPFRFIASNISLSRNVQLSGIPRRGGTTRSDHMGFSFQIQSEPKNPMLGVTQPEVISAVDEFGSSLVLPRNSNERSHYYHPGSMRGHNTYGNLSLTRGDKSSTTIKSLKGRIGIIMLSGTVPEIVIADPLKQAKKTFVGRTTQIEFGALTADANNKNNYTLEVSALKLGENDPNRPDYNWSNVVWQKFELTDADGNRYHTHGPSMLNNNGNSAQMTLMFHNQDRRGNAAKLGPPVKLVVNEWLSVTHEVTFEFKDIPLP